MTPQTRKDGLLIQKVEDELVVYDQERDRAHSLNRTSALVWGHCDGQKTVAEITSLLQKELEHPVDEDVVWLALDRFEKAHLLDEPINKPHTNKAHVSRREVLSRIGVGLAFLLPVVASITAPTPLEASSHCISTSDCSSLSTSECPADAAICCEGGGYCRPNASGRCECQR